MMHRTIARSIAMLLLCGGPALAQDMPPRKAGLWEVMMSMQGGPMPAQQMKMCIDSATDGAMYKLGMNASQGICDKHEVRRNGSVVTIDADCKMGTIRSTSHAVSTFTGDTAYHTDITTKFDPPMAGRAEAAMTQDAKWSGPCPPDMEPGDVAMPNGMKMNIKQMLGGKP